ncbi:MAG TPA: NADPH:quinone oxidoreductase family protein [Jatrophihabitans sp.]|nr:NADPH:quinone oxidoreductase family protein [Jatrophihabitans sp.]
MKALRLTSEDGPDALEIAEIDTPSAGAGEVLIDVHAAGVSFVDLLMTRGQYQERPDVPFVPGIEVSGVVREAPAESGLRPGERVAAHVPQGGYAEVVAAGTATTFRLPDALSFRQGTALAVNYQTAHFALIRRGRLAGGDHVLVHGAAGGVGTASIQLAKGFGAQVTAVVRSERNAAVAKEAGADDVLVMNDEWVKQARQTCPEGYAIVVDPVGGQIFDDSLRLLAPEGRHLVIGFAAGGIPQLKVNRVLLRNVDVVGVGWGAFLKREPAVVQQAAQDLGRMAGEGVIRPVIGGAYALDEAATALRDLEGHRTSAKVVIDVR